jgi:hypothetical protein
VDIDRLISTFGQMETANVFSVSYAKSVPETKPFRKPLLDSTEASVRPFDCDLCTTQYYRHLRSQGNTAILGDD